MKVVTTEVKYKVPDWQFCNHTGAGLKASKTTCRFCTKHNGAFVCTLYNEPLSVSNGFLVDKTCECARATMRGHSAAYDELDAPISISPKDMMKATIKEYRKVYQQLVKQGYPDAIADTLAQKALLGGA